MIMNIEGLDYNTKRSKLILPEYGRELQEMVDYCVGIDDRKERQRCAETIVEIMDRMFPHTRDNAEHERKLWDNLAIMSEFKLDIDWPYDVSEAKVITTKPDPMPYPMTKIPVRHYGNLLFEIFEKLKSMPEGPERDELVAYTANQMKRSLVLWSHGSADDEKVADDLSRYTDGKIQLDLDTFKFGKVSADNYNQPKRKKRR